MGDATLSPAVRLPAHRRALTIGQEPPCHQGGISGRRHDPGSRRRRVQATGRSGARSAGVPGGRDRARTPLMLLSALLLLLLLFSAPPARAQFPRFSAGLGAGIGGLRYQEFVGGVPYSAGTGRFSGQSWWLDLTWNAYSGWTFGVSSHLLRVPIDDGGRVGTFDLLPVVAQVGLRRALITDRLWGFLNVGAGLTWSRYVTTGSTQRWESLGGGHVHLTRQRPFTFSLMTGLDYGLTPTLLLEAAVGSVQMDSEISYRTVPPIGSGTSFVHDRAALVEARHLLARVGVRWWFEWW